MGRQAWALGSRRVRGLEVSCMRFVSRFKAEWNQLGGSLVDEFALPFPFISLGTEIS